MRWLPLLLAVACGPPEPVRIDWTVRGVVPPGAEVRAVRVELDDAFPGQRQEVVARTRAERNGRFAIDPGVDDDRTFLVVHHVGRAVSEGVSMADVAAQGRTIELPAGPAPVAVAVHAGKGEVLWQAQSYGQGGRVPIDGAVTIRDMPPGEVHVGFQSDAGYWESRRVEAIEGLTLRFEPRPPVLRRGVVVDSDGDPIAGAWVHDAAWPRLRVRTGRDGRFALPGGRLDEESYLVAVASGFARGTGEAAEEARVELETSVAFRGRVTDTDGRPLVGARARVFAMDDPPIVTASVDGGHFFFDHGRPKEEGATIFGVEVEAPGYRRHETGPLPIDRPGVIDLGTIRLEAK